MNDDVDRLIVERQALDRGFSRGFVASCVAHATIVGVAVAGPILFPSKPVLHLMPAFVERLPPGGGGPKAPAPAAAATAAPQKAEPTAAAVVPPKPEAKPQLIKPPKDQPKHALPMDKKVKKEPTAAKPAAAAGSGTASNVPPKFSGLDINAPPGEGVPGGTDPYGDFYMAQVKRKILQEWNRTLKRGMIDPIIVRFTILADGTVEDIELVQPSGSYLDAAAKSAVQTAGPFNKLPAHYETNRKVVEALFRPTP